MRSIVLGELVDGPDQARAVAQPLGQMAAWQASRGDATSRQAAILAYERLHGIAVAHEGEAFRDCIEV